MQDRRAHPRRELSHQCWIAGDAPIEVRMRNVSLKGARLDVKVPNDVPVSFELALTADGKLRRACRVVWRGEDRVGITFDRDSLVVAL